MGGFVLFGIKYVFAALLVSSLRELKQSERHAYYDDDDGIAASPQERDVTLPRQRRSEL